MPVPCIFQKKELLRNLRCFPFIFFLNLGGSYFFYKGLNLIVMHLKHEVFCDHIYRQIKFIMQTIFVFRKRYALKTAKGPRSEK